MAEKHHLPVIGIFSRSEERTNGEAALFVQECLAEAIDATGGIPLMLTPTTHTPRLERYLALCDGFLVPGGRDINAMLYGEEPHPSCGPFASQRDTFEQALIPRIVASHKPLLGICRGHQMVNVALGGTLWQDLPSQFVPNANSALQCHRTEAPWNQIAHTVCVEPSTRLADILERAVPGCDRTAIPVNSLHHQAVRAVAPSLLPTAFSPDGVIEALEIPGDHFVLSVQWHPEFLWEHDPFSRGLFEAFIEAASASA